MASRSKKQTIAKRLEEAKRREEEKQREEAGQREEEIQREEARQREEIQREEARQREEERQPEEAGQREEARQREEEIQREEARQIEEAGHGREDTGNTNLHVVVPRVLEKLLERDHPVYFQETSNVQLRDLHMESNQDEPNDNPYIHFSILGEKSLVENAKNIVEEWLTDHVTEVPISLEVWERLNYIDTMKEYQTSEREDFPLNRNTWIIKESHKCGTPKVETVEVTGDPENITFEENVISNIQEKLSKQRKEGERNRQQQQQQQSQKPQVLHIGKWKWNPDAPEFVPRQSKPANNLHHAGLQN